jgi:quercetin dioxygenase-like cupin family protein
MAMQVRSRWFLVAVALLAAPLAVESFAKDKKGAVMVPRDQVQWSPAGVPGVSTAAVRGDMAKGPSHFYLKYDAGFVAPPHHHSPDHFVTVVSGTVVLIVDGRETVLAPGSFFSLTGKAVHAARVEGDEPCVMFVDARGPWDVVLEKAATAAK